MSDTRIEYWLGITECECDSPHPIGACLRCDLLEIKSRIEKLEADKRKALEALRQMVCFAERNGMRKCHDEPQEYCEVCVARRLVKELEET